MTTKDAEYEKVIDRLTKRYQTRVQKLHSAYQDKVNVQWQNHLKDIKEAKQRIFGS